MDADKRVIIKTALFSRLTLILIQYIANILIPDHDAAVFQYIQSKENFTVADQVITHFFGGFLRWDAQYFIHIAKYGYTYENVLAFFPLYPLITRFVSVILGIFIPFVSFDSVLLSVSIGVNLIFFILSAICLYELSMLILNRHLALKAAILFCYNPASIFFTAPYTECMFSYLSFKSMLNCITLYKKYCNNLNYVQIQDLSYIIPICLSTVTRSNGVLNIGFLIYILLCLYYKKLKSNMNLVLHTIKFIALIVISIILCLLPFIMFQLYSFKMFCSNFEADLEEIILEQAEVNNFILPGTKSMHNQSWCLKTIPLAYSYVQDHYWNVGFLKYYEVKQIPNFILAGPVIVIILKYSIEFFSICPKDLGALFNLDLLLKKNPTDVRFRPAAAVYVIHATVLVIFCLLNIHVQVTTRMLCSASPLLYWIAAFDTRDLPSNVNLFKTAFYRPRDCVLYYFLAYFVVGTVMFCNFLPWT